MNIIRQKTELTQIYSPSKNPHKREKAKRNDIVYTAPERSKLEDAVPRLTEKIRLVES